MRLKDKVAIVVGSGQTPGETIGNGRATAIRFAEEGARLLLVDISRESAEETAAIVREKGAQVETVAADVTKETDCAAIAQACRDRYGRIDILHNNVGKSRGDAPTTQLTEENWLHLMDMNLKSTWLTCKHVLPTMREQKSGSITNISSTSALCTRPNVIYKVSKAGVITLSQNMAMENAPYGIRVNTIVPGYIDTPMAIERRFGERNVSRDVIRGERDAQVPLRKKMGTGWDIANAAVFLNSDEADYITAIMLPVDGGLSGRVG